MPDARAAPTVCTYSRDTNVTGDRLNKHAVEYAVSYASLIKKPPKILLCTLRSAGCMSDAEETRVSDMKMISEGVGVLRSVEVGGVKTTYSIATRHSQGRDVP